MLKKGLEIKWHEEPNMGFHKINQAMKDTLVLRAPNYAKHVHIFSLVSFHTVVVLL